jgi:hypothetical protein
MNLMRVSLLLFLYLASFTLMCERECYNYHCYTNYCDLPNNQEIVKLQGSEQSDYKLPIVEFELLESINQNNTSAV